MVSWRDGEESSQGFSSASEESIEKIYDSDYYGDADGESPPVCKHGAIAAKFVAFDGVNTGRRFLACAKADDKCDYVDWVDQEWPPSMQKALSKLWDKYADTAQGRVQDALDFMERKFEYQDQIHKLNTDLRRLQEELTNCKEENIVLAAEKDSACEDMEMAKEGLDQMKITVKTSSNLHKVFRILAEREKEKVIEEKHKLEVEIEELVKEKTANREKIRKIRRICEEPSRGSG